jgi:acetoacetyl-CoA synthetase
VRIGTAEIYRVVEQIPEVVDSLVVHLEDPSGGMGELILLVQVGGIGLDETLEAAIRSALRSALSPRHVPDRIVGVSGVPRNLTGKKLELPVKKILQGADVAAVVSRQAMANPDTLDDCLAAVRGR